MTRIDETGTLIAENEPPDVCARCGDYAELRPYGPGGTRICYACGQALGFETVRRYHQWLNGEEVT